MLPRPGWIKNYKTCNLISATHRPTGQIWAGDGASIHPHVWSGIWEKEAYENQDYQFEDLVESLKLKIDKSRNPIFDTMLNLRNMGDTKIKLDELEIITHKRNIGATKLDIELSGAEKDGELLLTLDYSTDLFKM